jgi:hypothetical protein
MRIILARGGGISKGKWCCHIIILIVEWTENKTRERERREREKYSQRTKRSNKRKRR